MSPAPRRARAPPPAGDRCRGPSRSHMVSRHNQVGDTVPRKGRARRFREARELKQGYDDGLFSEGSKTLADLEEGSSDDTNVWTTTTRKSTTLRGTKRIRSSSTSSAARTRAGGGRPPSASPVDERRESLAPGDDPESLAVAARRVPTGGPWRSCRPAGGRLEPVLLKVRSSGAGSTPTIPPGSHVPRRRTSSLRRTTRPAPRPCSTGSASCRAACRFPANRTSHADPWTARDGRGRSTCTGASTGPNRCRRELIWSAVHRRPGHDGRRGRRGARAGRGRAHPARRSARRRPGRRRLFAGSRPRAGGPHGRRRHVATGGRPGP